MIAPLLLTLRVAISTGDVAGTVIDRSGEPVTGAAVCAIVADSVRTPLLDVAAALQSVTLTECVESLGSAPNPWRPPESRPATPKQPLRDAASIDTGAIQELAHEHGSYLRYVPEGRPNALLVIVHGTIGQDEPALRAAESFCTRWTDLADQHQIVLLAPAFDQENFGGHAGPGGGYRGLFGRDVGADVFVNAIVDDTRDALPALPEKFGLYGHSAGGQFVSRYLVMHPERVAAAVISAAGTFAFPDPDVAWTNGMKPLRRRIRWSDDEPWRTIEIIPDPDGWVKASQIPITVVVGEEDTDEIKAIAGNPGRSHVERAKAWVRAMNTLARDHNQTSRVQFVQVPGVGHNSAKLTPICQRAIVQR